MLTRTVSHAHWILALMLSCSGKSLFLLTVLQPFSLWLPFAADWNQRAGRFGAGSTPLSKPGGCVPPLVEGLLCTAEEGGIIFGQLAQLFHVLFCFIFPTHISSLLLLGPLFPSWKIPSKLSLSTWENLPSPFHLSWKSWTTT